MLTDADGCRYHGGTPIDCERQFQEAMHYLAEHARKSGYTIEELRTFRAKQRDCAAQCMDERSY